ncbi:MAG TPA: translocation/assembly module TamB domain-containing protein [Thermoanaerobaculia bacterium]
MSEEIPPKRRWRWRKVIGWTALVAVVLPVLLLLAVLLSLRAEGVRDRILARVSAMLAEEYGLALTVEDFTPSWRSSRVNLRNVRVGAPGAAPLVVAERVGIGIELSSLRRRPLVLRELEIEGVRADLNAPIPKIPETPEEAGPPVEIRRIVVRRGSVLGAPLTGPAAQWLRGWTAREVEATGAYRGGRLDLDLKNAKTVLDRPDFGRQELSARGKVAFEPEKPLRLDDLVVTGDGLKIAASGSVGLEEGAPVSAVFDVQAETRALVAGVPPRGQLHASGNVALPENQGKVTLTAQDIPAEALRPYVDPKLWADLSLAGTAADLQADAAIGPGEWTRVDGKAEATWRRGRRRFADVEVRVAPSEAPLVLEVAGDLLPGSPGRRVVRGKILAQSWTEMARATADGLRAEVRLPDVRAAVAEVRSLWPRLIPAPPSEIPLQGSLTADLRVSGTLEAPDAGAEATWIPRPGSRVRLEAKGKPLTWTGNAKVQAEALPLEMLGAFAPGLAGTFTGTADLSGSRKGYRTRVEAATAALAYPPVLEGVESANVTANGTLTLQPLAYRGTVNVDGSGLFARPNASGTARVGRFQVAADGLFNERSYTGRISLTGEDVEAPGTALAERVAAEADGRLVFAPLAYDGALALEGTGVEAPGTARVDQLRVAGNGKLTADLRSLAATARVEADRIVLAESGTEIRNLHAEGRGEGREVHISALSGELPEGRTFAASGRVVTDLSEADLFLNLVRPVDAVTAADLTARLRSGVVDVDAPRLETASGPVTLRASIPLGSLAQIPQLAEAMKALPLEKAPGRISLQVRAPELDSQPLLAALGMEPRPERVRTGLDADLTLDPTAPAAGKGEIRLTGLIAETPDGRVVADGPAVLRLDEGRLDLLPVHLNVEGGGLPATGIDFEAGAVLARSWSPLEDPVSAAVRHVFAKGSGTLDAALLNPFLEGGVAEGSLSFEGDVSGPPDRLQGNVQADGRGVSLELPGAGVRVENPQLTALLRDGGWRIERGVAEVNGGQVSLEGGLTPAGAADVEARLTGVRYRLDYGVETVVSGNLRFQMPPGEGRSRLTGAVTVDRGVLDRDVNLDREVLAVLFAPDDTPGTEESFLSTVDLDLDITTRQGVRVRNNVGDLRASWQRLDVTGTLEEPVIRGRIDLDPGGLAWLYSQTVRIDRGTLVLTGDPLDPVKLENFSYTTSLQDPRIASLRGESPLDLLEQNRLEEDLDEDARLEMQRNALTQGVAGYYSARLAGRLGRSLGLEGFSVRPTLVFTETDPSARLTVGRDLSRNVSLAFSLDLRNAERQTYLLYVQNLTVLPGLRIEGFTTDASEEGASLQQSFELGGGAPRQETGPRLRRVEISTPKGGVSKRRLRRAIRLEKGDPVPEGAEFGAELDVAEYLRRGRKVHPSPRIEVRAEPVASRPGWVDLAVTVEPGPRASFVFAGDRPPRALRSEITALYRADFYEQRSLEEMRKAAVRAFRSAGHLRPQVAVEVQAERPEDPDSPRTVTIRSDAGRRASLEELEIVGLPAEEGRRVAASFPGTLSRAELASREPGADRRLLNALRSLGYTEPKILTRFVPADGSRVAVGVEPGPRKVLTAVEVAGVEEGEGRRLQQLVPLRAGDPARNDLALEGALRLGEDLARRGYADATVQFEVTAEPARLVYTVTPGTRYQLAGFDFEGDRWSRSGPLRRSAEEALDVGAPFTQEKVEEARSRIFQTGAFSQVDPVVEKEENGEARVSFSLIERPRFVLRYGLRWESAGDATDAAREGWGAVFDAVDQNFLGRGMIFGLRALYQEDDRSGRLYLRTGNLLGTDLSLESYAEIRRRTFGDSEIDSLRFIEDREEASLQLSKPVGRADQASLYARYRTTHLYEEEPDPFFPFDLEIKLPYLGVNYLRDTRDDRLDPNRGLFGSLDLSGSGSFLGSDFEYARLFAQTSSFVGLRVAGRSWIWAQSVRVGLAHPFGGQELIRDERFFAGGPYSVRGYEFESLGPQEFLDTGRSAGGEALFVLNEEVRFALPWDLTGLVFFDAGQVWAKPGDVDFDLAKALGLGLRARTPVGLLRFDAGFPLDRREGDDSYQLYFGLGNTF